MNINSDHYYVQSQNPVFYTFLDSTKAFDNCKLFKLLVKHELRVLANLFINNLVWVSSGGAMTHSS